MKEELARRVEGRKTRKEMGSRWTRGPLILGPCFAEAEWNTRFFERMVSNTCEGPLGEGWKTQGGCVLYRWPSMWRKPRWLQPPCTGHFRPLYPLVLPLPSSIPTIIFSSSIVPPSFLVLAIVFSKYFLSSSFPLPAFCNIFIHVIFRIASDYAN